jgi:hypothetical protein
MPGSNSCRGLGREEALLGSTRPVSSSHWLKAYFLQKLPPGTMVPGPDSLRGVELVLALGTFSATVASWLLVPGPDQY